LQRVLTEFTDTTVIYIDGDEALSPLFSRKLSIKQGRLSEADGKPEVRPVESKLEEPAENLAEEVLLLRQIPMLSSFDISTLKLLAFTSKRLNFDAGADVFQQGEKGDTAYIIIEGQAEILIDTDDGPVHIRDVNANEIFGEIALLGDIPRTATVRVKERLTTLELSKRQFFTLMEQNSRVAIDLLKQSATRLEQTTALLAAQKND
jgi:CRP-like cAMP-binding protein